MKTLTWFATVSFATTICHCGYRISFEGTANGYSGGRHRRTGFGPSHGHRVRVWCLLYCGTVDSSSICPRRAAERARPVSRGDGQRQKWRQCLSQGSRTRTHNLSVCVRNGHCDRVGRPTNLTEKLRIADVMADNELRLRLRRRRCRQPGWQQTSRSRRYVRDDD